MNLSLNKTDNIKQKITIASVVFILVLSGCYYFVFYPIVDGIIKKKTVISNLKIENLRNREKELNMDILTSKLNTIEPQIEKLDNTIVSDGSGLEFIVAMEDIAKKNDIIQTLDMKEPLIDKSFPDYKTTPLEINARGDINNIYKYLQDLESMNYYFNIEEFTLTSSALPGETTNQVNMHLIALSYWSK